MIYNIFSFVTLFIEIDIDKMYYSYVMNKINVIKHFTTQYLYGMHPFTTKVAQKPTQHTNPTGQFYDQVVAE